MTGSRIAVGAPRWTPLTTSGGPEIGAIFLFELEAGGFVERMRFMTSTGEPGNNFGWRIAMQQNEVFGGAYLNDGTGPVNSGAVFAFSLRNYQRGDVNVDSAIDIADVIFFLGWQFTAAPAVLPCNDAGDANDDGQLNIADAISLLTHLFVAGSPPIPAPTSCGPDPTSDALGCVTFDLCP
jgi:hypothetical protein